jgi:hypothetical protein
MIKGANNRNSALENVIGMTRLEQEQQSVQQRRGPTTSSTYHGRRIAEGLSYYLTKCAATASGGIGGGSGNGIASRPLSCVGLLACGGDNGRGSGSGGSLHIIDSTGSHRVRAHAIGDAIRASRLHRRMMHVDFSKMDCQDGLRVLLRLIAELEEEDGKGKTETRVEKEEILLEGKDQDSNPTILNTAVQASSSHEDTAATKGSAFVARIDSTTLLQQQQHLQQSSPPRGIRIPSKYTAAVELAVLPNGKGRMRRVRLSSLFASPLAVGSVEGRIA